jgi:hypothetical protein
MILAPVLNVQGVRVAAGAAAEIFNAVIVAGAGTGTANGTYLLAGEINGKPSYVKGDFIISYNNVQWIIFFIEDGLYEDQGEDEPFPWIAPWGALGGDEPPPSLTPTNV